MKTETIVCLAAPHLDSIGLSEGFSTVDAELHAQLFDCSQLWLGPRPELETNERYRQLVSYVVFRHADAVLTYRRTAKGGESRLHGRTSVGVGGHVNAADVACHGGEIDIAETLRRACAREIAEEVQCGDITSLRPVGVIKESVNAVSRVHLGVVVECWLTHRDVRPRDPGLVDLRFVSVADLTHLADEMETWSACLLSYLSRTS
jgi:predicted NUDIX family phosphoesterase